MPLITEQQFGDLTNVQEAMLEILDFERRRIALDLHDRVQNSLRLIRDEHAANRQLFEELEMVLQEVRTIAYQLTPKSLQEFSLVDYLNIYETNLNLIYGDQFNTDYRSNLKELYIFLPKSIENQLFSIVQECVTNVLKHGYDTPLLCIRLRKEPDAVVLLVQDFGQGFDSTAVDTAQTVGLHSIATRANFIGAKCEIEAAPDAGCKVRITVPISVINTHKEEMQTYEKATKTNTPRHVELKSYPTKHILVVDNQREIALGLQDLLERVNESSHKNRKVYLAHSVADAKRMLEKHQEIEVVITDITMPDESGMRLVKYIHSKNEKKSKKIQCIFYSINDNPAYIFRAKNELKVSAYVWKEEIQTDNDEEHAIIQALAHLEDKMKSGAFYSKQIQKIEQTLVMKPLNKKEDEEKRKIFKDCIQNLNKQIENKNITINKSETKLNKDGKTVVDKTTILRKIINENVPLMKNEDTRETMQENNYRYFDDYNKFIGINKEAEMTHLLIKIAADFGIE